MKKPAKTNTKPVAAKASNVPLRRKATDFYDARVRPLVTRVAEKFLRPAWTVLSERLWQPAANSDIGKVVIKAARDFFEKRVRPVTVGGYTKYVKPERHKLFRNALIAWGVMVSAIFIDWPGFLHDGVEELLATDFTGTEWRIESEDAGKGVFVRLDPKGAVQYNTLEAKNYASLAGSEWTRLGRNGLEIKIDSLNFTAFTIESGGRTKLNTGHSSFGSYGLSRDGASGGNWYLTPANGGAATAAPNKDPDREALQALVGPRDRPAIHFVRRMDVAIPGHAFNERCREMAQLLQRKELYLFWSIIRVKGADTGQRPYLMWRDTIDGAAARIAMDEDAGNVPAAVANVAALAPGDPALGKALTRLGASCGLGSAPVAGNGHLHIPVLALVVPEGQAEPNFSELTTAFQELVGKLAQGRNQAVGDVLVLNVPPKEEGAAGAGAVRYTDLEGFARMGATEVTIERARPEPVRRRIIRKLDK